MERYRLKNIIILILVLLNAFLLVSLGNTPPAAPSSRSWWHFLPRMG